MTSDSTFRNPFSDYNANVIGSERLLQLWCSPFSYSHPTEISESEVFSDSMPILFFGGRGTGKTMFLRYFSYDVQCEAARQLSQRDSGSSSPLDYLAKQGSLGVYLRFDGPVLRSFEGKSMPPGQWDSIFTHYFELTAAKGILDIADELLSIPGSDRNRAVHAFWSVCGELLDSADAQSSADVLRVAQDDLNYITEFRGDVPFEEIRFSPRRVFTSKELSFGIARALAKAIHELTGFPAKISYLIDEYENFSRSQQRIVNTLVKFVEESVTFRLGMRLEGLHTYETISKSEFLKEGRDYSKYVFESFVGSNKVYRQFLKDISRKRLESVPLLREKGITDIEVLLGRTEDLEEEAKQLVQSKKNPNKHLYEYLAKGRVKDPGGTIAEELSWPDNPLFEMLNVLWYLRGRSTTEIRRALEDYQDGTKSADSIKYHRDYVDKYKLSLMILLAAAHDSRKLYYSFNTFSYLSSGIAGQFIELCRRAFRSAFFESRDSLLENSRIPPEIQDKAALEVARDELEMVSRVWQYGDRLSQFARNLGSLFRIYHKDFKIRYPETNQFAFDKAAMQERALREAFDCAIEWSIIQKKPTMQQPTPGAPKREIYTLNRIFAPLFDLTYRTRGGYSEPLDPEDIARMMMGESVIPKKQLAKEPRQDTQQQTLDFK